MSLLRIFLSVAFCCLSLNIAIASDKAVHTIISPNLALEQSLLLAERPTPRRRGVGCKAPNVWALNISVSCENRSFCYAAPEDVSLWQPENSLGQSSLLTIKNTATKQKITLRWQAGQASFSWPIDKMPIESDVEYSIKMTPKTGHSTYHFKMLHQIPANHNTPTKQAEWMKENGCTDQAKMLLEEQKV